MFFELLEGEPVFAGPLPYIIIVGHPPNLLLPVTHKFLDFITGHLVSSPFHKQADIFEGVIDLNS